MWRYLCIKRSICGCTLKTGSIIIALINIIYYGIMTAALLYILFYVARVPDFIHNLLLADSDVVLLLILNIILFGVRTAVSVDLLYGASMGKKYHLIPFCILVIVTIFVRIIYIIITLFEGQILLTNCLLLGFESYFLLHVLGHYMALEEDDPSSNTEQ